MSEVKSKSLPEGHVLKVGKKTNPYTLSTSIIGCIKDFGHCTLESVMERATFQATKALILSRSRLAELDMDIEYTQGFMDPRPMVDGKQSTGIRTKVKLVELKK